MTPQKEAREPRKSRENKLAEVLMLLLNDPVISGMKARIRDAARHLEAD